MLFVVFLLFLTNILVEIVAITNMTSHENKIDSLNISAFPTSSQMTESSSVTSLTRLPNATMPDTLSRNLSNPGQPELSLNATPPVSKQELQSVTTVNTSVPEDTSSPIRNETVSIKEKQSPTEASEVQKSKPSAVQMEVTSKMTVKPHFNSEVVPSPTKDSGTRSQGSFFEKSSAITYPETTKSTEPKDYRKGPTPPSQALPELTQIPETGSHYKSGPTPPSQVVPELTQIPETGSHYKSGPTPPSQVVPELTQIPETGSHYKSGPTPPSQVVPELTQIPETGNHYMFVTTSVTPTLGFSDKSPSEKKNSLIILAVVFSILVLIGLLIFLYLRRRRHSGSTSFNSPEWAGQATLPDDTGLDKDVEQQKLRP